jgi:hypothetical protein
MPYGWITAPPIREVDRLQARDIAGKLQQEVASWGTGSETWDTARRYHVNKTAADKILKRIEQKLGGRLNYVYEYGGQAVGLLIAHPEPAHLHIDNLVAHPGTEGCGATLLEFAFNLSQKTKKAGKLSLESLNQNSTDFYLTLRRGGATLPVAN